MRLRRIAFVGLRVGGVLRGARKGIVNVMNSFNGEDDVPDYFVCGAGASGLSFVDTLLLSEKEAVSVVIADARLAPGGHWNDAYDFARLHQRRYGVESTIGEIPTCDKEGLASRDEILEYYAKLLQTWRAAGHDVHFLPETKIDDLNSIQAKKFVVDATYTENEIPKNSPPKFKYNKMHHLITPNELSSIVQKENQQYCVLGSGKTGQDCVLYLLEQKKIMPANILWVAPRDAWFTARDPPSPYKQLTCMELLDECLSSKANTDLSAAFLRLEQKGLVYRLDPSIEPQKFMDATLSLKQIQLLRTIPKSNVIRGHGRLKEITFPENILIFEDGQHVNTLRDKKETHTTFIHCTASAFNFQKRPPRPIFEAGRITIQEIFSFPGFCFNAAVIAWLTAQSNLDIRAKNLLCQLPPPASSDIGSPLGEPKGLIGDGLDKLDHPLILALNNLCHWYETPGMGEWLHSLRLFSLTMNGYSLEEGRQLAQKNQKHLSKISFSSPS